jgi:hypothetical protein
MSDTLAVIAASLGTALALYLLWLHVPFCRESYLRWISRSAAVEADEENDDGQMQIRLYPAPTREWIQH